MPYTMDGYRDLDLLTDELWDEGVTCGAKTRDQLRGNIAWILRAALNLVPAGPLDQRSSEFYAAVSGIVECAEQDELI